MRNGKGKIVLKDASGKRHNYELRVMKVNSRHPDGTPKDCVVLLETKTIELKGGEEFMTCWLPSEMMGNEGEG